jgi:hypothetical protein
MNLILFILRGDSALVLSICTIALSQEFALSRAHFRSTNTRCIRKAATGPHTNVMDLSWHISILDTNSMETQVRSILKLMIIRRKDGYFVISEKGKKKLGGPYKKRKDAELRLRQVEYFKHLGK